MAKILLQTTIPSRSDDWHVGRFALLADELRAAGHDVTTRDRGTVPDDDAVLSTLDTTDYDELWLMAVDTGNGLTEADASGIVRFRERGGGMLTARDHEDLGCCLCSLGSLGRVNHFHNKNPEPDAQRDDQDNPNISWPNYHSGNNGDYQPVFTSGSVHDVLRTPHSPSGRIEWFPAHPHEGAVSAPPDLAAADVVAQGRSSATGRLFNLAVAIDGETNDDGEPLGRALATSTFHQFADFNWDVDRGAPSFVADLPGVEIKADPLRLDVYREYVCNTAAWLAGRRATANYAM